jgi:hypothetical protein
VWNFWWTKWHWDRIISEFFCLPLQYNFTDSPYWFMYHLEGWERGPLAAAVPERRNLTPSQNNELLRAQSFLKTFAYAQLLKKSPAFYEIRKFIFVFTVTYHTERRGGVGNTPTSYFVRPGFKSLQFWQECHVVFLRYSWRMPEKYLKIRSRPLHSKSFPIHHSRITLSFDNIWS